MGSSNDMSRTSALLWLKVFQGVWFVPLFNPLKTLDFNYGKIMVHESVVIRQNFTFPPGSWEDMIVVITYTPHIIFNIH